MPITTIRGIHLTGLAQLKARHRQVRSGTILARDQDE
jgi:hypothetical protein